MVSFFLGWFYFVAAKAVSSGVSGIAQTMAAACINVEDRPLLVNISQKLIPPKRNSFST
jgi:hypothetical protein